MAGFATGLAALPAIALSHFWIGLGLILAGRALAFLGRGAQPLASALDPVFFASLPFAFALADPGRAVAATFVLFAFVASIATTRRLVKIDKAVAILAAVLACVLPERFSVIAYALGIAGFVAAGTRLARTAA